jgi:maleylacetate reductase
MVVASTGIALQPKLAHTVAGCCNLPHAETQRHATASHSSIQLAVSGECCCRSLGQGAHRPPGLAAHDIVSAIVNIGQALGIQLGLREIGMREDDIGKAAHIARRSSTGILDQ